MFKGVVLNLIFGVKIFGVRFFEICKRWGMRPVAARNGLDELSTRPANRLARGIADAGQCHARIASAHVDRMGS